MLCISGRIADAEVPVGVLLFRWLDDRHYVDARNQLRTTPRTAGGPRPDTQGKIARGGHTRKNRHPWRERHTMTDTPCFGNHTIAMKPTALFCGTLRSRPAHIGSCVLRGLLDAIGLRPMLDPARTPSTKWHRALAEPAGNPYQPNASLVDGDGPRAP
jgi:hypothetical protein